RFEQLLGLLSEEKDRDALRRYFRDGETLEEIAKAYGVTRSRIQWIIQDALVQLRLRLKTNNENLLHSLSGQKLTLRAEGRVTNIGKNRYRASYWNGVRFVTLGTYDTPGVA